MCVRGCVRVYTVHFFYIPYSFYVRSMGFKLTPHKEIPKQVKSYCLAKTTPRHGSMII